MNRTALTLAVIALLPHALAGSSAAEEVKVSHCFRGDTVDAINDGIEPRTSNDKPRHSFWDHKGTREWVEYHFGEPRTVSATEVFWLDDAPWGGCSVPLTWQLSYQKDGAWIPVKNTCPFGVEKDVFNRVTFEPVAATALRIDVELRPNRGGGIVEWDVRDDPRLVRQRSVRPLDTIYFAPRSTPLLEHVRTTYGLSRDAQAYLNLLGGYEVRANELRQRTDAGSNVRKEEVGELLRKIRETLCAPVRRLPPVVFFTRHPLRRPNAANCSIWQSSPEQWGCAIRILNTAAPDAVPTTIFEDPDGAIYDMNLSPDATTLYFSYRRKDEPCWQIHEIRVDGTGLKRISRDPQYHEVGAIELPSGELAFVSTRRIGYTVCQPGPTSNLYVMDRDGANVRCVSQNTLSDFSPQMLPDGRVLFTRWEYIDRDLTYRQSLWTQNPDGRRYQLYYGNTIRDVGMFWQARPVMNRANLVVATFAPHHAWPHGAIGLIQNQSGLEAPKDQGFTYITREIDSVQDRPHRWAYRDPFPLNDYQFLVSCGLDLQRFALCLLDLCGNHTMFHADDRMGCYGPLPLTPRDAPPQLVAVEQSGGDPDQNLQWGAVMVADVYVGVPEIERGRIKYVQVMEQMRKLADLTRRAYDQSPAMGYATYYAKKCWGRVPVEEDGSVHIEVPALREVYLQVLDADGRELQRMTSALQVMPGETVSCIGCHENRQTAPPHRLSRPPVALNKPTVRPELPAWGTDGVVDFVKVVQPVLDKYCVECHSGPAPKAGYNFSGDKTRIFNMAYDNLLGRSRSYRQHDMETGDLLSEEEAKGKPLVHFYWLLRTPTAVNRPFQTGSHASRLLDHIETDHCGRMIPLEDRERVYAWIDANVPYYATYDHSRPKSPGYRDLCTDPDTGKPASWYTEGFLAVFNEKCTSCHGPIPKPNDHGGLWDGRYGWMNFTHPEWSPALVAHLSKKHGGWGIGTESGGEGPPLFKSTKHSDYAKMLEALKEGREVMFARPRVDMVAAAATQ
ncbi:MAG: hypothetical protein GY851_33830 [bacterium]|nr:hypothetical protein [bacterium]